MITPDKFFYRTDYAKWSPTNIPQPLPIDAMLKFAEAGHAITEKQLAAMKELKAGVFKTDAYLNQDLDYRKKALEEIGQHSRDYSKLDLLERENQNKISEEIDKWAYDPELIRIGNTSKAIRDTLKTYDEALLKGETSMANIHPMLKSIREVNAQYEKDKQYLSKPNVDTTLRPYKDTNKLKMEAIKLVAPSDIMSPEIVQNGPYIYIKSTSGQTADRIAAAVMSTLGAQGVAQEKYEYDYLLDTNPEYLKAKDTGEIKTFNQYLAESALNTGEAFQTQKTEITDLQESIGSKYQREVNLKVMDINAGLQRDFNNHNYTMEELLFKAKLDAENEKNKKKEEDEDGTSVVVTPQRGIENKISTANLMIGASNAKEAATTKLAGVFSSLTQNLNASLDPRIKAFITNPGNTEKILKAYQDAQNSGVSEPDDAFYAMVTTMKGFPTVENDMEILDKSKLYTWLTTGNNMSVLNYAHGEYAAALQNNVNIQKSLDLTTEDQDKLNVALDKIIEWNKELKGGFMARARSLFAHGPGAFPAGETREEVLKNIAANDYLREYGTQGATTMKGNKAEETSPVLYASRLLEKGMKKLPEGQIPYTGTYADVKTTAGRKMEDIKEAFNNSGAAFTFFGVPVTTAINKITNASHTIKGSKITSMGISTTGTNTYYQLEFGEGDNRLSTTVDIPIEHQRDIIELTVKQINKELNSKSPNKNEIGYLTNVITGLTKKNNNLILMQNATSDWENELQKSKKVAIADPVSNAYYESKAIEIGSPVTIYKAGAEKSASLSIFKVESKNGPENSYIIGVRNNEGNVTALNIDDHYNNSNTPANVYFSLPDALSVLTVLETKAGNVSPKVTYTAPTKTAPALPSIPKTNLDFSFTDMDSSKTTILTAPQDSTGVQK